MHFAHSFAIAAIAAEAVLAQAPAANAGSALFDSLAKSLGIVFTNGGLDVSASVCETFKPGNWLGNTLSSAFGSPYYGGGTCQKDTSGGSGKYKANYTTDPTIPKHTIYAPLTPPPASEKLPVIIWGNGACLAIGTMFQNFLTEIASHGFFIVANGDPIDLAMSSAKDLITAINWVTTNPAAKKYGNIDLDNIAIAGQSCGGGEAIAASQQTDKHKITVMFNSGGKSTASSLKKPIAYFTGGKTDIATTGGAKQFQEVTVPTLIADADIGHIGTYYQLGGGKTGKVAVSFFKWQLKKDESMKPLFCAQDSALLKDGWTIKHRNGMC